MQITFGRAIKLNQDYTNGTPYKTVNSFPIKETVLAMTNDRPSVYDKETSDKIRGFLRAQFNDYNKKTGVIFKEYKGSTYALTGKEAEKIKNTKHGLKCAMSHIVEDGKERRPKSSLTFSVNKQGELSDITYYSTQKTKDGCNATCEILTI